MSEQEKPIILIVDDAEINRFLLSQMLGDTYTIWETDCGQKAIELLKSNLDKIALILLDFIMPDINGIDILKIMNREHWIEDIPVIMITTEDSKELMNTAYNLGITDYIQRPFNVTIVHRRVINTIMVHGKKKQMENLLMEEISKRQKNNRMLINILSHIVEFRNGESGLHVIHIQALTELILKCICEKSPQYNLSEEDVYMIATASALHDIGKMAIPDNILNKPGKLTDAEFAIMKTHSAEGAKLLELIDTYQKEPLVKITRDICRWHHERYDGRGYPDGLKGEEIPLSAQVVSIADVYDALTSERCYKKAFPHEKAIDMIINGECGTFNPILIDCLKEFSEEIKTAKSNDYLPKENVDIKKIIKELMDGKK